MLMQRLSTSGELLSRSVEVGQHLRLFRPPVPDIIWAEVRVQ